MFKGLWCCSVLFIWLVQARLNCYFYRMDDRMINWVFLLVTAFIAYHALTHRNQDGENDIGHLLFGSIALLFFMRVLVVDILKLM